MQAFGELVVCARRLVGGCCCKGIVEQSVNLENVLSCYETEERRSHLPTCHEQHQAIHASQQQEVLASSLAGASSCPNGLRQK